MVVRGLLSLHALDITPGTSGAIGAGPPLSLTLMMAFTCCAIGLIVGVLVLGFVVAMRNKKTTDQPEPDERQHE